MDLEEGAVAVSPGLDLAAWRAGFDDAFAVAAGRFARACSRKRARAYLLGLLSRSERKNSWTIAEFAGDATPDGMQRLLNLYPGQLTTCVMTCGHTSRRRLATRQEC